MSTTEPTSSHVWLFSADKTLHRADDFTSFLVYGDLLTGNKRGEDHPIPLAEGDERDLRTALYRLLTDQLVNAQPGTVLVYTNHPSHLGFVPAFPDGTAQEA